MFRRFNRYKITLVLVLTISAVFYFGMNSIIPDPDVIEDKQSPHQPADYQGKLEFNTLTDHPVFTQETYQRLLDTVTLNAHPGPSNNGGSPNWAMFLDLIAGPEDITVTQMSTASTAGANASYSVEVYTRQGTALGGPVGSGPGSSPAGWTLLGTVPVTQGPTANGVSLLFTLPPISVSAGDTVGVAIKFLGVGPRYFGTGTPPLSIYSDANVTLITGDGRSAPFTTTGSWFSSRAMNGAIRYVVDETPSGNSLCFNRNGVNLVIPDGSGVFVYDTIKVQNNMGNIDDITVNIDTLTHTYLGDLICLLSHAGQTDTLFSRMGTGTFGNQTVDMYNVKFSDSSSVAINSLNNTTNPSGGTYLPGGRTGVDSLRKHFKNQNLSGNWVIALNDNATPDGGTLQAWSICFYSGNLTQIFSNNTGTPDRYSLGQNYPNPFNPTTKINFNIPKAGLVSLKVYDMLGREVRSLVDRELTAGVYTAEFDGGGLSSGTYFYRLQAGDFVEIKKMVLLK
jgi:subtilisin-like proprotein convertase family protein